MQKNRTKIVLFILCVILITTVFSGCSGGASLPMPTAGGLKIPVTGNCEMVLNEGVITVSGQTDLMDGVLLNVSVVAQDGMVIDSVTFIKNGDEISQDFQITAEKYDGVKSIIGYITCSPSKQTEAVYAAYGEKFASIELSDFVWDKDGIVVLFGSEMIDL